MLMMLGDVLIVLVIMRCIFLRAHAPARAINIIVHVFLLLLRMTKKYAA